MDLSITGVKILDEIFTEVEFLGPIFHRGFHRGGFHRVTESGCQGSYNSGHLDSFTTAQEGGIEGKRSLQRVEEIINTM